MTDQHGTRAGDAPIGRLDLSALDAAADEQQTEIMIRAVMQRIPPGTRGPDIVRTLAHLQRGMAAAAILLAILATAALMIDRRHTHAVDAAELLDSWVQSNHVPTNGELLTAYQGYRP